MQIIEDRKYVKNLKNGDITAFDALFRKYSKNLFAFALSITKETYIAEEITQLVFIKVWEKKEKIQEHLSFKSFLFSIAYNLIISWLRKEKSEKQKINKFGSETAFTTDETNYTIEFNNMNNLAKEVIESFPEKRKRIFKLSREQGLTNKEIAKTLNISVKTVENQISIALKTLRNELGKDDILGILFYFITFR